MEGLPLDTAIAADAGIASAACTAATTDIYGDDGVISVFNTATCAVGISTATAAAAAATAASAAAAAIILAIAAAIGVVNTAAGSCIDSIA